MKKIFLSSLILAFAVHASEVPADPTEKYCNKKADEAILHDAYYEAEEYKGEIPNAWKEAVAAFGYKENEIEFYTAVRINKFVERVKNKLVILRPNFELYCTPEEQKAYIGLQLASLKQGVKFDVGCSHGTFFKTEGNTFRNTTIGLTAFGLLALYHKQLVEKTRQYAPAVKNVLFSQGAALVAACWLINEAKDLVKEHKEIKQFNEAQFEVIEKMGADGLLSIREKQANWGKNNAWWMQRKWNYVMGKLSLAYSPQANLELIQNYVAQKEAAK